MSDICFETERLQVRHLAMADLDDLAALCADPVAMQYMGDGNTLDRETCLKWIDVCAMKYAQRGYGTSGVYLRETGGFIGFCGVVRSPGNTFDEVVYAFAQPYWGMGYATEVVRGMLDYVFSISDLRMIYATIASDNVVSMHIVEKLGFVFVEDKVEDDGDITRVFSFSR